VAAESEEEAYAAGIAVYDRECPTGALSNDYVIELEPALCGCDACIRRG
jgi:hypothetical protein